MNNMNYEEMNIDARDLNQQGIVLAKCGNLEKAVEKFLKAIEIEPMFIDSYKNLGDLYLHSEKYGEAKSYFKKALLIEKSGEVYFQYGNACFMNDEPHEGLEYYNMALTSGYDNDEMLFFMGMAYEHLSNDKMALRYFQKAINKNPSRADYQVKKISALLRLNMLEEARAAVDKLLVTDPELYDGYHIKTALLLSEGKFEEAIENSRMASDKFPEDADLLFDYANAITMSGNYDKALKILENAEKLKYYEESVTKFLLLGAEIYAEKGEIENAIIKCDECISLESDDLFFAEARFMRINLALTVPDFETALNHSLAIINHGERNSYYYAALYYRPFCQTKLGKVEEANANFKEAISLYRLCTLNDPTAVDAYLYRSMCLKELEKYDDALEMLELIENICDQIAEIYTLRADIYNLTNRQSLAKEELDKAYAIKPELRLAFEQIKVGGDE
ncbi:MAG: tetratricopeptide repeat protein [Lachnospira sp.]